MSEIHTMTDLKIGISLVEGALIPGIGERIFEEDQRRGGNNILGMLPAYMMDAYVRLLELNVEADTRIRFTVEGRHRATLCPSIWPGSSAIGQPPFWTNAFAIVHGNR